MAAHPQSSSVLRAWLVAAAVTPLAGCESLALTSFGVGASAAVSHTLSGITYRTFTAPAARVKSAASTALGRMGIRPTGTTRTAEGEVLTANAAGREIEIRFEPISPNATRMRVIARNGGLFYDSATATEIILQTERLLGVNA